MALEAATTINQLVVTNPLGTDTKSQGDDHLRLIKKTLLNTFPNITGPVTVSHGELNGLAGGRNLTFPGMIIMWAGSSPPPGWKLCDGVGTISNGFPVPDLRNKFILGGGLYPLGSTGGSETHGHSVTVAGHVLALSEIPSHTHTLSVVQFSDYSYAGLGGEGNGGRIGAPWGYNPVQPAGGGGAHSHGASADPAPHLPPYYVLAFIIKD